MKFVTALSILALANAQDAEAPAEGASDPLTVAANELELAVIKSGLSDFATAKAFYTDASKWVACSAANADGLKTCANAGEEAQTCGQVYAEEGLLGLVTETTPVLQNVCVPTSECDSSSGILGYSVYTQCGAMKLMATSAAAAALYLA